MKTKQNPRKRLRYRLGQLQHRDLVHLPRLRLQEGLREFQHALRAQQAVLQLQGAHLTAAEVLRQHLGALDAQGVAPEAQVVHRALGGAQEPPELRQGVHLVRWHLQLQHGHVELAQALAEALEVRLREDLEESTKDLQGFGRFQDVLGHIL